MQGRTKSFQKNANISLVLSIIRQQGQISRIDIARRLGLNRSTITYLVTRLLETGLVRTGNEGGTGSQGGRKPVLLQLDERWASVLGLEIQFNQCRAVLTDMNGRVVLRKTIPLEWAPDRFAEIFLSVLDTLRESIEQTGLPLLGIGLGVSGWVDPYRGLIVNSFSLKLNSFDFYKEVASRVQVPVLLENDANCCAWGELCANKGEGPANFLYILPKFNTQEKDYKNTCILGIGMGLVVDNKVYSGNNYAAGEFRSVYWTRENHEQVGMNSEELKNIETDPGVLRAFVRELCLNLSVIVSIFNPGRIYIGGDLGGHFDLVMKIIKEDLKNSYIAFEDNGCEFRHADFDDYDVAAGAAEMFLENLFDIPKLKNISTYYFLDWEKIWERFEKAGNYSRRVSDLSGVER